MIIIVSTEAADANSIAALRAEGAAFSTNIGEAEDIMKKRAPERQLIITFAPSLDDVKLLMAIIKGDDRLNYLVLTGPMSKDDMTLAQALVTSSRP